MAKMGWTKFWFRDYEADFNLRLCSFAAQGLWMRMLCRMDEGEPRGHLTLHGKAMVLADFPKAFQGTIEEIKILLQELESNQVFAKDKAGTIYCRRMVREADRNKIQSENGSLGGRPKGNEGDEKPENALKPETQTKTQTKPKTKAKANPKKRPLETLDAPEAQKDIPSATHSGAAAPAREKDPYKDRVWQEGVAIVVELTRKSEDSCRKFLGKLLSAARDDNQAVWMALQRAKVERPVDLGAWMVAALKPNAPKPSRELAAKAAALALMGLVDGKEKTHKNVPSLTIEGTGELVPDDELV